MQSVLAAARAPLFSFKGARAEQRMPPTALREPDRQSKTRSRSRRMMRSRKDMATASRVCSLMQAILLGLNKGQIGVGKDAHIIVLDAKLEVVCTVAAGTVVYQRATQGRQREGRHWGRL